ncbi:MAG: hypothetical protein ACXVH5_12875 [Ilumatobacteraceae bacterium]
MSVELHADSPLADLELAHDEAISLFHQGDLDQAFEDLHGISLQRRARRGPRRCPAEDQRRPDTRLMVLRVVMQLG